MRRQRTDVVGVLYSNPLPHAFDDAAAVSFLRGMSAVTEHAALGLLLVPAAGEWEIRGSRVLGRPHRRRWTAS